jgi:hypothetical protein
VGRVKEKPLLLFKHHVLSVCGVVEVKVETFLPTASDECERSDSVHVGFASGERAFGRHWIGAWLGPSAGVDAVANGGTSAHTIIPSPVVQP